MKLISWNVNGLRSIFKKGFPEFLADHSPDILCLQEIKICEDQLNGELTSPEGYQLQCSFAEKRGYSGVGTYFAHSVTEQISEIKRSLGDERFDSEGRYLISRHPEFTLYNVYFPSGTTGEIRQQVKYDFLEHFLAHITALPLEERQRLVICGDFNICHRPIDIHHPATAEKRQLSGFLPEERAWMDRFVAAGFVDTFRLINGDIPHAYSWWTFRAGARQKNLGWRIDYFFVAEALAERVKNAGILPECNGSDHCPVFIELDA